MFDVLATESLGPENESLVEGAGYSESEGLSASTDQLCTVEHLTEEVISHPQSRDTANTSTIHTTAYVL